jgi:hypothetical protein
MKRTILVFVAVVLFAAVPAQADRKVMLYCDSRCDTGSGTTLGDVAHVVDMARTDFTVCKNAVNGRTTVQALLDEAAAIAACQATGTVTDFVELHGVNDYLYIPGTTPADTADRRRQIAANALAAGVTRAWIMAEPPAPQDWTPFHLDANAYTRDTAFWLQYDALFIGPVGTIMQARDRIARDLWYPNSSDHLHPTTTASRQALADEPISVIP